MNHDADDLALDDPAFLETLAAGFERVKVRAKHDTASAIAHAAAGRRAFRDRAIRLRAIARRLREGTPA